MANQMNFLEIAHFNHDQSILRQRIRDKQYIADEISRRDRALIENSEMCSAIILDAKQYEKETKLKIQTLEENARKMEALLHDKEKELDALKVILYNKDTQIQENQEKIQELKAQLPKSYIDMTKVKHEYEIAMSIRAHEMQQNMMEDLKRIHENAQKKRKICP